MEIKKKQKNQLIRLVEISVILVFFLFLLYAISGEETPENIYKEYNQEWKLSYGKTEKKIDLPINIEIEPDIVYKIEKKLPENLPEKQALVFRSRHQKVEIFLDGKEIYRYPKQENKWYSDGRNWNFADLPKGAEGKQIEVRFVSKYRGFSGNIGEMCLGDPELVYYYIREKTAITFFLSAMIGVIGSIFWIAIFWFYPEIRLLHRMRKGEKNLHDAEERPYEAEEMLAVLLMTVSIWLCGESKMPIMHTGKIGIIAPALQDLLTCLALLLIPVFFEAYMCRKLEVGSRKTAKILFRVSSVTCIFLLWMQFLRFFDLIEVLSAGMVMIGIVFLHGIVVIIREVWKKTGTFGKADFIFIIVIGICVIFEISSFFTDKYSRIGIYIREVMLVYAFYILIKSIRNMYLTMKENERLSAQLQESRVELMMSQIRPHFIYNTLNSIRTLVKISPDEACDMIYDFSNYLRANVDFISEQKEVLFSEEEEHIRAYVNIEQRRFGNRLCVKYDIRAKNFYLPMLSVQPLVENAIKYGVCKSPKGGTVTIRAYETDEAYFVEVEDDGVGFDVKQCYENRKSTGLRNIWFRLRTISSADLHIDSEIGKGTKAVITIPKNRDIQIHQNKCK